jgi:predicted metal-dependent hydrolase
MSTETRSITVSGIPITVDRKNIKNLHLGVYPPNGRVRVAAPLKVGDDAVRLAVISRLAWIRRQQARFQAQPRQSRREMVSGECHYFLGARYRLKVIEGWGPSRVELRGKTGLMLHSRPDATAAERDQTLQRWYRDQLSPLVQPLVEKWQQKLGVRVAEWRIKKMKTKWGSCTVQARRIWLNLELVKKPVRCLEYIVVHEMVHLLERSHNERFVALMDKHMPLWRQHRDELNAAPLAHWDWQY